MDGARRQIQLALDAGVNLIDTADVYSEGTSEEIVGQALPVARDDILLATKVRMPMGDGPNDAGLSRHHIIRGVRGLAAPAGHGLHRPLPGARMGRADAAGGDPGRAGHLVDSGKVRYVGASNYTGWQLMKALGVAERTGGSRFVSQQIYYSLQARDAEYELVPVSVDQGLGILVWSPLAGGLLSGKYRRGAGRPSRLRAASRAGTSRPCTTRTSSTTRSTCWSRSREGHGVSAAQVALAWTWPSCGHVADHRGPHRRAAGRQPARPPS